VEDAKLEEDLGCALIGAALGWAATCSVVWCGTGSGSRQQSGTCDVGSVHEGQLARALIRAALWGASDLKGVRIREYGAAQAAAVNSGQRLVM
jgi:hypothetical protein